MKNLKGYILFTTMMLSFISQADFTPPPENKGLINVKDFGAKGDGKTDDTKAIQSALSKGLDTHAVVYIPNGTYLVNDSLKWWRKGHGGKSTNGWGAFLQLQGQSKEKTVIRLKDNADGFNDSKSPRGVIITGSRGYHGNKKYQTGEGNEAFENNLRDFTVIVGKGNPGAIGIDYQVSNSGAIRNVQVICEDQENPAAVGINMARRDNGPGLLSKVSVKGFNTGLNMRQNIAQMVFEHIKLTGQKKLGFDVGESIVTIRKMTFQADCTALKVTGEGGLVLIDSKLSAQSPAPDICGIILEGKPSGLVLGNVAITGYQNSINNKGKLLTDSSFPAWSSEAQTLGENVADKWQSWQIPDTPEVKFGSDAKWIIVPKGQKNITAQIQEAMDSGARAICLPRGKFTISKTLNIPPSLELITSVGTEFNVGRILKDGGGPLFKISQDADKPFVVDRISLSIGKATLISHTCKRPVVIRDMLTWSGKMYENKTGAGDLFIENVAGTGYSLAPGTKAWCRQLNIEGKKINVVAKGAQIWVLGCKNEGGGTFFQLTDNSQAQVWGAFAYTFGKVKKPAFIVENSNLLLSFYGKTFVQNGFYKVLVQGKENDKEINFAADQADPRGGGKSLPFLNIKLTK